jgi:formate dehydrogenase subunit gamma
VNKPILSSTILRVMLSVLLVLCFNGLTQQVYAQQNKIEGIANKNPGSNLWRDVRQRDMLLSEPAGVTQSQGVDAGVLVNDKGDQWRKFRMDVLVKVGIYAIVGIVLIILLFYLIRGKVKIENGLSGNMVFRFTDFERIIHWVLAFVFLFLAITGLILLLGRNVLIPVLGHDLFSLIASSSKEGHNLFGPVFLVSIILMLIKFMRRNIYAKGDLTWLLKGGGMIGKSHVTGGFFNMGEKSWYWMVIIIGLLISFSGLILVSPVFGQGRVIMEISHVLHASGAILLIVVSIGHMYLGSVGTEGTKEGMINGYVDINWASEHHDRWAKYCKDNDLIISAEEYAALKGEPAVKMEENRS